MVICQAPQIDLSVRSLITNPDEPIAVFEDESPLYKQYFLWFLEHTDEKQRAWQWFQQELLSRIPSRKVCIDAGAGTGELLAHFLPEFEQCLAIEPNPAFGEDLLKLIPANHLYPTTILAAPANLPKANLVVESHVKYYMPLEEWESCTDRELSWLVPGGCLVEIMTSQHADFARLMEIWWGPEYVRELQASAWQYRRYHNVELAIDTREAWVYCSSLEQLLGIAIFIMNAISPPIPADHPRRPTREQLARWLQQEYALPGGGYRMSCCQDFVQYFRPV